jgi:uncharacterized cupredoxin-like copper-binding protein
VSIPAHATSAPSARPTALSHDFSTVNARLSGLRRPATKILALAIAVFAFGGCSESGTSSAHVVNTTMTDFVIRTKPAVRIVEVKAGSVRFNTVNKGLEVHEIALFRTALEPDQFPINAKGGVIEKGAGLQLISELSGIKPKKKGSFVADLKPGKYVMICNLNGTGKNHYAHGMFLRLNVTA